MISEELKKMFEGRIAMQDMHYVGKACYGRQMRILSLCAAA